MKSEEAESSTAGSDHGGEQDEPKELAPATAEDETVEKLGISLSPTLAPKETVGILKEDPYNIIPNPDAEHVDLSSLRGTKAAKDDNHHAGADEENIDLDALAELVPSLKMRNGSTDLNEAHDETVDRKQKAAAKSRDGSLEDSKPPAAAAVRKKSGHDSTQVEPNQSKHQPLQVSLAAPNEFVQAAAANDDNNAASVSSVDVNDPEGDENENFDHDLQGFDEGDSNDALQSNEDDDDDENAYNRLGQDSKPYTPKSASAAAYPQMSSAASLSTATQTHEVRMPMYLPTFKPAIGCTNASDFIVRCFVARLRSGITVVKHGRSRWCKSRLRQLHVHSDGRSLSWKPATGEPTTSKRPPKLDLSTCTEVRHAWSPDPMNPVFTGTPILRQKCEAANAHKSFALIFPKRTVDITAVTADQCKVLMEGFSALCFRLQVASLAGKGGGAGAKKAEKDELSATESNTLTNNSAQVSPASGARTKKRTSSTR